ncbi:MAG: DUF4344 domain-containing metallopeptidase [Rhodobacteraceae bacterium]|nr:DUF4344 domain-containing metallopeptidase [Paracoccaceae bacterium]
MMRDMLRVLGSLLVSLCLSSAAVAEGLWSGGGQAEGTGGVWSKSKAEAEAAGEAPDLTDAEWHVRDVMLAIFYHEMGHALIDVMQLPVLGLEEDAADVLSVVMIDRLWDAESSEAKVAAAASFWATSALETAEAGYEPAFWGVHSPDERRYFTYLCLYYGGAPDEREALAVEFGLPEDRAVTCADEFDLAASSWGVYLDELEAAGPGESLVWMGAREPADFVEAAIREEVEYLNSIWTLPETVGVQVGPCEEANAFYDPGEKMITMCSELADYVLSTAPME